MVTEQASPSGKSALATSWYGRSDMGTRIDNEGTVPMVRGKVVPVRILRKGLVPIPIKVVPVPIKVVPVPMLPTALIFVPLHC